MPPITTPRDAVAPIPPPPPPPAEALVWLGRCAPAPNALDCPPRRAHCRAKPGPGRAVRARKDERGEVFQGLRPGSFRRGADAAEMSELGPLSATTIPSRRRH